MADRMHTLMMHMMRLVQGMAMAALGLFTASLFCSEPLNARGIPLFNPGFEERAAAGLGPNGWSLSEWTGGATDISVERVPGGHAGACAARVTWRSGGSNVLLHQAVSFAGQHRCRLSFFVKTDGHAGVSSSIRTLRGQRVLQYNSSLETVAKTDWTRHVFEFTTHPQTERLIVYLRQRGGTVWFDDVSLKTIPSPKPLDWRLPEAVAAWKRFAPHALRRNNFVIQLLDIKNVPAAAEGMTSYPFATPRDGWIHIEAGFARNDAARVRVSIDASGDTYELWHSHREPPGSVETMLHVHAGVHTLHVQPSPETHLLRLGVRAIPELICSEYESAASGREKLMARFPHLLEDYNVTLENFYRHLQDDTMLSETIDPASRSRLNAWIARGGRALTHSTIPGLNTGKRVSLEKTTEFWTRACGMRELHGIMCDEFGAETPAQLAVYTAAIERIAADERFAGKTIHAYGPPSWGSGAANRTFRETLFRHGHKQALEMYLREQPSETDAKAELANVLTQWVGSARLDMPGSVANTIIVLCCCSKNYYGMDCFAGVDFRVFLDMQFHLLATDPTFKDLGGLSAWILRSADDETVDWLGRLHRHYAIKGRTDRLSEVLGLTYRLPHLSNPDFVNGLQGWRVDAAQPRSIQARVVPGFGLARGTMLPAPVGDSVAVLKRTGREANRLTQTLRQLRPGALYSVVLYSGDAVGLEGGTSTNKTHALGLRLEGATLLPDRTVREAYDRVYAGREQTAIRTWFNRHAWVFRAKEPTAELTITDAIDQTDGHPISQTLMLNFVQVQRLLADL